MMALAWKIVGGLVATALLGGGAFLAIDPAARIMIMGPPHAEASFLQESAPPYGVPFDFFRQSRIYLKGQVNGVPTDIMLDSGAGMSVIDKAYAQRIGLRSEGEMTVQGQVGAQQAGIATGVTIEAGGVRLNNAALLILDLSEVASRVGRPLPFILGRDVFQSSVVELDFQKRIIAFRNPASFSPPKGAVRLSLEKSHGGTRVIPASVNGLPQVNATLDLGNGGSLIVSQPYWTSQKLLENVRSSELIGGGVGGQKARKVATLRSVTIGGTTFRDIPASFNASPADLPPEGINIGIDLLSRFRLAVDYGHDVIYLTPVPIALTQPLRKERSGLRFELAGDRLRVISLSPGGPAARAGFKVGDEIIAVDGEKVSPAFYFGPHSDWDSGVAGTKVDLLGADGKHRELILRDYF